MSIENIPEGIKKAFNEYGFNDYINLENVVAWRCTIQWYALLFKELDGEGFFAIDFRLNSDLYWEVQNDYVGPFSSVKEFSTEKLTSFFV